MDADYVMHQVPSIAGAPVLIRRAQAMRQWGVVRADNDYNKAQTCIARLLPREQAAWLSCRQRFAQVPQELYVRMGEKLLSRPVCVQRTEQRIVLERMEDLNDPLLSRLADLDQSAVLEALQPFDPLSWLCHRVLQETEGSRKHISLEVWRCDTPGTGKGVWDGKRHTHSC